MGARKSIYKRDKPDGWFCSAVRFERSALIAF